MTDKIKTDKITAIRNHKTNYIVDNTIVGTSNRIQYQKAGHEYWYDIRTEDCLRNIGSIDYLGCYGCAELTPQGQKMLDEHNAEKTEKEEDDD